MPRSNKGVKGNHEEALINPVIKTLLPDPSKMNKLVPRSSNSFVYTVLICSLLAISALAVASSQFQETNSFVGDAKMSYHKVQSRRSGLETGEGLGMPTSAPTSAKGGETLGSTVLNALRREQEERNDEDDGITQKLLVHSGTISLGFPPESKSVGSIDTIANQIETIVQVDGNGYIESKSKRNQIVRQYVRMDVRVANDQFSATMEKLQNLTSVLGGTVESLETRSEDVTDQYIDITARADTLAASRKAIEGIMSRADKVQDVLKIQHELNSLMQHEESQRKRALQLKNSSDMSTISLTLIQTVRDANQGGESPWHPQNAMSLALGHVAIVIRFTVHTLSYALVWLVPLAAIFLVVRTSKLCATSKDA